MKRLLGITGIGMCLLLAATFAIAGNGRGRGNGAGHMYQQTHQNRNQQMRRNFVDNNHDGNCDNREAGQGRQMRQGPGFSQPNGARSGARDGNGPINRSGGSRPSHDASVRNLNQKAK
ncbi:MAG: hypothetical protein DSY91_04510 [Deltaproteobacteria bacterium]|nr:MAG: hypothetical protein DSY91_04510 [Deltaproteobacteria bacterium]